MRDDLTLLQAAQYTRSIAMMTRHQLDHESRWMLEEALDWLQGAIDRERREMDVLTTRKLVTIPRAVQVGESSTLPALPAGDDDA